MDFPYIRNGNGQDQGAGESVFMIVHAWGHMDNIFEEFVAEEKGSRIPITKNQSNANRIKTYEIGQDAAVHQF
jgi:hypothetical protein